MKKFKKFLCLIGLHHHTWFELKTGKHNAERNAGITEDTWTYICPWCHNIITVREPKLSTWAR